jgi:hypothetical protein
LGLSSLFMAREYPRLIYLKWSILTSGTRTDLSLAAASGVNWI